MAEYNMAGARYRSAYLRDGSKTKRATAATLDEAGETVLASAKAAIAKGLKAGDLVKAAAQLTGGNGGGRPDMAQAGGRDVAKISDALNLIREKVNS